MKAARQLLVAGMLALACTPQANAQSSEWERTLLVYALGAGIDGESQLGPIVANADQSFSDMLENLDVGGMGSFRATKEPGHIRSTSSTRGRATRQLRQV